MTTTADIAAMLQAQGTRLFHGGSDALTELELSVSQLDFQGLATVAPVQIQVDVHHTVPVIVLSQQTSLHAWEVPAQYNLTIAVTEINSGAVHLFRPLVDPKDEEPAGAQRAPRPPKPTGTAAEGISTKANRFDVEIRGMHRGSLAISALSFDVASNATTVNLVGGQAGAADATPATWSMPSPNPGLPTFAPATGGDVPTSQRGLNFAVTPPASGRTDPHIRGAFSKNSGLHECLPAPRVVRDNGVDRQVIAVVPLTVAILGLDGTARLQPLAVPVYGADEAKPGQLIGGHFETNIPVTSPLVPGKYAVYVFMDGVAHGPQMLRVP
jgi:hypothetical protein